MHSLDRAVARAYCGEGRTRRGVEPPLAAVATRAASDARVVPFRPVRVFRAAVGDFTRDARLDFSFLFIFYFARRAWIINSTVLDCETTNAAGYVAERYRVTRFQFERSGVLVLHFIVPIISLLPFILFPISVVSYVTRRDCPLRRSHCTRPIGSERVFLLGLL